jgi:hypothetical protein
MAITQETRLQAFSAQDEPVQVGDAVTSSRRENDTLGHVSRANEPGRDGKVIVNGREHYARVWGLTVRRVPA